MVLPSVLPNELGFWLHQIDKDALMRQPSIVEQLDKDMLTRYIVDNNASCHIIEISDKSLFIVLPIVTHDYPLRTTSLTLHGVNSRDKVVANK